MDKYDAIFESLQEKVNSGEITIEEAEAVNTAAYEKYVVAEESKAEDVADLLEELSDKVKDGDIVLMHDIYSATANALGIIIPSLKSKGYTFVTVSDLFYYKNIPLEKGKVYGFAR